MLKDVIAFGLDVIRTTVNVMKTISSVARNVIVGIVSIAVIK